MDSGLGKASTPGHFRPEPPTEIITETGTELMVDGVRVVFQNTPGAEAPAEMMIFLPDFGALCGAENVSHVFHNVLTLRGAKVRDALLWSNYIDETIALFGDDTDVIFASHHWPTWGQENIDAYLKKQRDMYKFVHDQTLRLANAGFTSAEIAEQIELPESLAHELGHPWLLRHREPQLQGDLPALLRLVRRQPRQPAPAAPCRAGRALRGGHGRCRCRDRAGAGRLRRRRLPLGRDALEPRGLRRAGQGRPRALLADTYDQLGYQAESGPWRDFYLTGASSSARRARSCPSRAGTLDIAAVPTQCSSMRWPCDSPEKAEGERTRAQLRLHRHRRDPRDRSGELGAAPPPEPARDDADTTVRLTREGWNEIVAQTATPQSLILSGELEIDGSPLALVGFFGMLADEEPNFEIVRP